MWGLVPNWLKRLRGYFPMKLPTDGQELEALYAFLFSAYGFPDLPSYRIAVCNWTMHAPQTMAWRSPRWYAIALWNGQAKEVAYQVLDADRKRRAKEAAAVTAAIKADVIGSNTVALAPTDVAATE